MDAFLDRVEATLNGATAMPMGAQDVHDVVFRVRFGGYDEWQVDLHLDRVERQIAELEERAGSGVGAQLRAAMGTPAGDRGAPPPLPVRTPSAHQPTSTLPRFPQEQAYEPVRDSTYATTGGYSALTDTGSHRTFGDLPQRRPDAPGGGLPPRNNDPYGQPSYPTQGGGGSPFRTAPDRHYDPSSTGSFSTTGSFSNTGSYSTVSPPSSGFGPPPPPSGAESQRVDQLRRTFQLRRFGSGYDPGQVDRLFENVLGALSGRGGMTDSELDPSRLNLVPGGYYEAEVDQAIREVREILRAR